MRRPYLPFFVSENYDEGSLLWLQAAAVQRVSSDIIHLLTCQFFTFRRFRVLRKRHKNGNVDKIIGKM